MKVFDKAKWHIDAGMEKDVVVKYFWEIFKLLRSKGMLSEEGLEIFKVGIDTEVSLHERLLNEKGIAFLEKYINDNSIIIDRKDNDLII